MSISNEKIAIFTISSSLSGAEKRFIRLASEFSEIRDDIILILNHELYRSSLEDGEIKSRILKLEDKKKLKIIGGNTPKNKYLNVLINYRNLYKLLKEENVRVLHCSMAAMRYSWVKKMINLKILAEITSPDVAKDLVLFNKYRFVVSSFDEIIAVSEGVKEKTIKSLVKLKEDKLINKIYCPSIPYYHPAKKYSHINPKDKENLIVYASRFIERKNPILFSKVIFKILEENPEWKVAILGRGPLQKEIESILKSHIESGRVIVEHTKKMYEYLKRSKLFVSLIYPDNYPSQSLLEAMYMKNAILATNVGSTSKLVTEKNGFLVNDYEEKSVYTCLNEALSNYDKLIKLGEASGKLIEENFSKDIYIKEINKIYNRLK